MSLSLHTHVWKGKEELCPPGEGNPVREERMLPVNVFGGFCYVHILPILINNLKSDGWVLDSNLIQLIPLGSEENGTVSPD